MLRKQIQLGLIHVAVAATLVPINSTLNRVMINEMALSATLVAVLATLPYLFSPIQMAIGSFSDRFPVFGYRRTPYIVLGLILCVVGVTLSPYIAFRLEENWTGNLWLGMLVFGAWGMGFNFATVSYLSLASELSGEENRSRTISVMWFMMISGIILTAVLLSRLVDPYSPEAMTRAFLVIGGIAFLIGIAGLVRLEEPRWKESTIFEHRHGWREMAGAILSNRQAIIFFVYLVILLAAILGQDILLEPYGAAAFGMEVKHTTRLTAIWGAFVLAALLVAGFLEGKIAKKKVAFWGALTALSGFAVISGAGLLQDVAIFYTGVILLGIGTGLATVSNLSLMLDMTKKNNIGLFIGAWGMANAFSRLIGSLLGGVIRDTVTSLLTNPVTAYIIVFVIEMVFLGITIVMLRSISVTEFKSEGDSISYFEKASVATDI